MAKHVYLPLAALVILAIAVNAAPSFPFLDSTNFNFNPLKGQNKYFDELIKLVGDSAETSQGREATAESDQEPSKAETASEATDTVAAAVEQSATTVPSTVTVSTTRKPVLVLIRDALKKVTTGLPTEQVANNALQYFQLFEHFIQQTIEQVFEAGTDDDEEEEASASPQAVTITDDDKDAKPTVIPDTQTEKQTEEASASPASSSPVAPLEVPAENEVKPAEPDTASNAV